MTFIQITYLYPSSVVDVALVHQLVPYLYWELCFHQIGGLSFSQGCLLNGWYHFHSGFPPPLWYGLYFMVSWYIMFQVSLLTLPFPLFTCHASARTIITYWLLKYSLSILPPSEHEHILWICLLSAPPKFQDLGHLCPAQFAGFLQSHPIGQVLVLNIILRVFCDTCPWHTGFCLATCETYLQCISCWWCKLEIPMVVAGYKSLQYLLFFQYVDIQDGGELWNAII